MSRRDPTPEQRAAIDAAGEVLVSASAGSGKTFVMIEKIIALILRGEAETSSVLAVTFTNLAAGEMKERLRAALVERINAETDAAARARLKAQLGEIATADICTVHAFCTNVIRRYFYESDVAGNFRVADESEASKLRLRAVDLAFDRLLEEKSEGFALLCRLYAGGRGFDRLRKLLLEAYARTVVRGEPTAVLQGVPALYCRERFEALERELFAPVRERAARLERTCAALEEVPGVEQAVLTPVESAAASGTVLELTVSQKDGWQLRFGLNEGRCTRSLEQLTFWCENPRQTVPAAGEENVFDTLDFMNEEQRQLYEEATKAAAWLFGMAGNLNYTGPNENPQPTDVPDPYYLYNVVYASNFLEKRVLPLFTKEFLLRTEFPQKFKQYNGDLLVDRPSSRPMPYGTTIQVLETYPDRYRLVKSDENVLEFMLIAHYDRNGWNVEADKREMFAIEYPIRMVNTDDGWRLDEFHTTKHG